MGSTNSAVSTVDGVDGLDGVDAVDGFDGRTTARLLDICRDETGLCLLD